jgi:DNA-binding GntR family transcriptional regulator
VVATKEDVSLLDIQVGDGLILKRTIFYLKDNTPFEYDIGLHHGSKIRFEIDVYQKKAEKINLDIIERTLDDNS